jgi:hypothetical protein
MALTTVHCSNENHGTGQDGHIFLPELTGSAAERFKGTVQLAIIDRPEAAQSLFQWKAGSDDWLTSRNSLQLTIYNNRSEGLEEYLSLIQKDLLIAKELLNDTGAVYVFASQRSSARVRMLLDDVFGRSNFINEIIWAHDAGMKPAGRFTRAHETIFLYRKGRRTLFNAAAAGRERGRLKSHMKRTVEGGRVSYTRESGGKLYRYFEDEIVSVGDVWTDIPEVSAKDEERVGWEGQRPEVLLRRMIAASSAHGDIVCDLGSASATVASVAQKLGRRALLSGTSPLELMMARRRLLLAEAEHFLLWSFGSPQDSQPEVSAARTGDAAVLRLFHRTACQQGQPSSLLEDGLGSLEYWAAGWYADGAFSMKSWAMRTRQQPTLPQSLPLGQGDGQPCIQLVDACGDQWFYLL